MFVKENSDRNRKKTLINLRKENKKQKAPWVAKRCSPKSSPENFAKFTECRNNCARVSF